MSREPGFNFPWATFASLEEGGDPLWAEKRPYSRFEAWLYLVGRATRLPGGRSFSANGVHVVLSFAETPPLSVRYLLVAWSWGSTEKVSRFLRVLIDANRMRVGQRTRIGDTYHLAIVEVGASDRDASPHSNPRTDSNQNDRQDSNLYARPDSQAVAETVVARTDPDAVQDGDADATADANRDENVLSPTTPLSPRRRRSPATAGDDPVFVQAWEAYPRRSPRSNLARSRKAWAATVARGGAPAEMLAAVQALAARVRRTGKEGTGHFAMFSSLFGPDQVWRDELADATGGATPMPGAFGFDTSGMDFD